MKVRTGHDGQAAELRLDHETMEWTVELDATGLLCPLPVLKARKRLQGLKSGEVLRVLADDPAAIVDVPHFCLEAGHSLLGQSDEAGIQVYLIQKA